MKLQFRFSNDVKASIDLVSKTIHPYTEDPINSEIYKLPTIEYNSDDDMVNALKSVSERVNIDQHRELYEIIFKHFKDADIKYDDKGRLYIKSKWFFYDDLKSEIYTYGYQYDFDDYDPTDVFIKQNEKRIASIEYIY